MCTATNDEQPAGDERRRRRSSAAGTAAQIAVASDERGRSPASEPRCGDHLRDVDAAASIAQPLGDVGGHAVDPRARRLVETTSPSRKNVNAPTASEREQRRQLEPEVAGRERGARPKRAATSAPRRGRAQPTSARPGRATGASGRQPRPVLALVEPRRATFARSLRVAPQPDERRRSPTTDRDDRAEREQPARDVRS